jgi:hypothetical protein
MFRGHGERKDGVQICCRGNFLVQFLSEPCEKDFVAEEFDF